MTASEWPRKVNNSCPLAASHTFAVLSELAVGHALAIGAEGHTFSDEAEQYLCAAVLRPGNVTASAGAVGILRRLMGMIRGSFPKVRIRVRLDGGFAHPALLAFLDAEPNVEYVVAMASNAVLQRKAEEAMQYARALAGVTDQTGC